MTRTRRPILAAAATLALIAGCEPDKSPKPQQREILKKTTQVVLPMAAELAKGAVVVSGEIKDYDPLFGGGKVYNSATGQIAAMRVTQDLEIYKAKNDDKYPVGFQGFIDEIIKPGKPDGINLPMRPIFQEYGYDEVNHKLVVLEYPERKAKLKADLDKANGR